MFDVSSAQCWMNGKIISPSDAKISVFDHGLLYGDGVFEGIRFYHRRAFRLIDHLQRLYRSAAAIRLTIPYDQSELTDAITETINVFNHADGYIRLIVTRGEGPLGLDPFACQAPNVIIVADRMSLVDAQQRDQGIKVITAATRRLSADGLDPRIKSLNYLNHILARMEAHNAGAQEAMMLNAQGHVTEGTADNVFIVRDGRLQTPPVSDGALEGITREIVLNLAASVGIPVHELSLAPYDIYSAEECFLTGTGAELIPVREIDGRLLKACPGPVYGKIRQLFRDLILRESKTFLA
jgi:branched-chain amino acid aminotransferase